MSEEEKVDPVNVFQMIEDYCNPRQSEVLMSYRFWNVQWTTPFDTFLTELQTRAGACNFHERDRMIRDKIVFSAKGKVQELLLRDATLDLPKAIDICRAYEQSTQQLKEMNDVKNIDKVDKVNSKLSQSQSSVVNNCNFCGGSHEKSRFKCPAWGQTCSNCKGRNHFKKKCKKPKVHSIESNTILEESDGDTGWLASVKSGKDTRVYAKMKVNDCTVRFQIDSGANVNTICQKYVKRSQVSEPKCKLYMWNNSQQKVLRETLLDVYNLGIKKTYTVNFTVVENHLQPLLGVQMCEQMDLITVNENNFI